MLRIFTFLPIVIYIKFKDIVTKENHSSLQSHCLENFHQYVKYKNPFARKIIIIRKIIQAFKAIASNIYISTNCYIREMQEYCYEGKSSKFLKPLLGKFTFPAIVVYVKCKDIITKENHPSFQNRCFEYLCFHQSLYM